MMMMMIIMMKMSPARKRNPRMMMMSSVGCLNSKKKLFILTDKQIGLFPELQDVQSLSKVRTHALHVYK